MPADTMEKPTASPIAGAPASSSQTPDKPKSASEHRKSSKPIMEKRRRARINESLGQLKTLILDALKKDSSRHSKLEKADILEMTVKHLRNLQRAQMTAALSADPTVLGKYRAGFNECMNEVTRFLSTCEGVNTEVRSRLLGHLSTCLGQIVAMNYPPPPPPPPQATGGQPAHLAQPLHIQLPGSAAAAAGVLPGPCKLNPGETLSPKSTGASSWYLRRTVSSPSSSLAHPSHLTPDPWFPLYANANMPVSCNGSTATPSVSPVQGLTSFGGSLAPFLKPEENVTMRLSGDLGDFPRPALPTPHTQKKES